MERPRHSPDDRDDDLPERENPHAGEVDPAETFDYDDLIADVVRDVEANGQLAEGGARTLAYALAKRMYETLSTGLYRFAISGKADRSLIFRELRIIEGSPADEETYRLALQLGEYVDNLPDKPKSPRETASEASIGQPHARPDNYPFDGSATERLGFYLRASFLEADARGETISRADAQAIATLLAPLLGAGSAMRRFAKSAGDINTHALLEECRQLQGRPWESREIGEWTRRLADYVSARQEPGQEERP